MSDYKEKFVKMRAAGNLAARTLDMLTDHIKPGMSTDKLDNLGYEFIKDHGAYSAPQFYRGFKKSLCTSLNHVVCHGIPSDRVLNEGDAINIDVTAILDGHYGDTSRMYAVGEISIKSDLTQRELSHLAIRSAVNDANMCKIIHNFKRLFSEAEELIPLSFFCSRPWIAEILLG